MEPEMLELHTVEVEQGEGGVLQDEGWRQRQHCPVFHRLQLMGCVRAVTRDM